MIKPTIGRVVLYQPAKAPDARFLDHPYGARVCFVWSDHLVNLAGENHNGEPFAAASVRLLQDDEESPIHGHFAYWMPYQKAVASGAQSATLHA